MWRNARPAPYLYAVRGWGCGAEDAGPRMRGRGCRPGGVRLRGAGLRPEPGGTRAYSGRFPFSPVLAQLSSQGPERAEALRLREEARFRSGPWGARRVRRQWLWGRRGGAEPPLEGGGAAEGSAHRGSARLRALGSTNGIRRPPGVSGWRLRPPAWYQLYGCENLRAYRPTRLGLVNLVFADVILL